MAASTTAIMASANNTTASTTSSSSNSHPSHPPHEHRGGRGRSSTRSSRKSKRGGSGGGGGARPQRLKSKYRSKFAIWLEPRVLKIATAVTMFGVFLQLIAISTDSWQIAESTNEIVENTTGTFWLEAHTGLWRQCRLELVRERTPAGRLVEDTRESCEAHNLFPSTEEREASKEYDKQYLDYTRTAIAFTIIALVITVIGHCFAIYALRRPRYIIKRLAALLHFMTAACLLVLNEVFIKTVRHERENMPGRIPKDAATHYGYSFVLSWLVFCFFVLAGLVFLFSSHKRKAEYADGSDALEDEPMEIFRR